MPALPDLGCSASIMSGKSILQKRTSSQASANTPFPGSQTTTNKFQLGGGCASRRNKRLLFQNGISDYEPQFHQNLPSNNPIEVNVVLDQELSRSLPHAISTQKEQNSNGSDDYSLNLHEIISSSPSPYAGPH